MHRIFYTGKARDNLQQIKRFIAKDSSYYAEKVVERINAFIDGYLSIFVKGGKLIDETREVRLIIEPTFRYRIVYKIDGLDIYIVSVSKYKQLETK